MRFVATETGGQMPLDPEPVELGNVVLRGPEALPKIAHVLSAGEMPFPGELRYQHHSASCPAGDKFRKR